MSEDVFRCDYCGTHASLSKAKAMFREVGEVGDGDTLYTASIYCSTYCGNMDASSVGS